MHEIAGMRLPDTGARALRALEAKWNTCRPGAINSTKEHPINSNIGRIEGGDWACQQQTFRLVEHRNETAT